jgi:prevent-host-death family protein
LEETVSVADANRNFLLILRRVRDGHSYVVTSHGRPVARIDPTDKHQSFRAGAKAALLLRLKSQPVVRARR